MFYVLNWLTIKLFYKSNIVLVRVGLVRDIPRVVFGVVPVVLTLVLYCFSNSDGYNLN